MTMTQDNNLINYWINFSKFHYRVNRSLDTLLQDKFNIVVNEFFLLVFLDETEEKTLRISQLQDKVGISQSALSRLIHRLETHTKQPVTRSKSSTDKRSVYITLTEDGHKFLEDITKEINHTLSESLSEKDKENIKTLIE